MLQAIPRPKLIWKVFSSAIGRKIRSTDVNHLIDEDCDSEFISGKESQKGKDQHRPHLLPKHAMVNQHDKKSGRKYLSHVEMTK